MTGPDRVSPQGREAFIGRLEAPDHELALPVPALEQLMPMHLVVDADGTIRRATRTLRKLQPQAPLEGASLFDVFTMRRPRGARNVADLLQAEGGRLSLTFRSGGHGHLKAVIVPLSNGGGALVNFSFGFSLVEAVRAYDLVSGDFAGTDLAIEMLYLVEAKSAALNESKKLNLRLQGAKIAAQEQAFTDTLTGLKNRRAMDHILERMMREGVPFALMHLDLDYFKDINDTYGHAAGDEMLQAVARILVKETRATDVVARIGGDEFVLILQGLLDIRILRDIAERIIRRLEEPVAYNDARLQISASIGLTTSERSRSATIEELLQEADLALYASKRAGRGRVTIVPAGNDDETAAPAAVDKPGPA
ncbi:MAG: diguanylate cyclase domain-containing protein [Tropicimonas sp.]|uniref:GGDEF domain-containing protein n=1 Tax=Tropicimonas sp. TaxID=2067044 RepID=UPI003A891568